jgi:monoamine oxidase
VPQVDVVVVGAGAAGLAAAHVLAEHGLSVAIVEARDRIGGRIWTSRRYGKVPAELGAEFIHGRPHVSFSLAQAAGLTLCELAGRDWTAADGQFHLADEQEDGLSAFSRAVSTWRGEDVSVRRLLETRLAGKRWDATRPWATAYVEHFDAAPLDDVSVQWLARDEAGDAAIEGDRQFRVLEGYDRLLEALYDRLDPQRTSLSLNAVVHEVHWAPGHVEVHTRTPHCAASEPLSAHAAVITLPAGVLAAPPDTPGGVRFVPDLADKHDALAGVAMGHVVRVVLHLREPFWDRGARASLAATAVVSL